MNDKLSREERHRRFPDLLYPQFDSRFADWSDYDKVLSKGETEWLREEAYNNLKGNPTGMADSVRQRMMDIVGGHFPLGFITWWEKLERNG